MSLNVEKKRLTSHLEIYLRNKEDPMQAMDDAGNPANPAGNRNIASQKSIATRRMKFGKSTMTQKEVERRQSKGEEIKT